ncbi:hypothetical protein G4V64_11245 [Enterococcus durans]|nr:hypothetical protein [Enterococcus durans]NEX86566.1 hypothetical protein [Enterococcus durans]
MFKPLIDSYSAVLKKFKGNDIGATINEEVNIERLKKNATTSGIVV